MLKKHHTICSCYAAAIFILSCSAGSALAKKPHGGHGHVAHPGRGHGRHGVGHVTAGSVGIGVGLGSQYFGVNLGPFWPGLVDGYGAVPSPGLATPYSWVGPAASHTSYLVVDRPLLFPAVVGEGTLIPTTAATARFQLLAEQAFRQGRYDEALKWSQHAVLDEPHNGKLHLFISQVLLALGDYRASVASLEAGISQLEPLAWGYVVQNLRRLYQHAEYAWHLNRLGESIARHPGSAEARVLRGYQLLFTGHPAAARDDLTQAAGLAGGRAASVARLLLQRLAVPAPAADASLLPDTPPLEILPAPEAGGDSHDSSTRRKQVSPLNGSISGAHS